MLRAICHDPSYSTGTWTDESLGIYVGWAELKDSFSDGMPLCNERGNLCLVFSGSEYSGLETVSQLRGRGHSVGASEAAYLVHLFEEDDNAVEKLNGMFHGLIVDRTRGVATLFNDRFGMHRLCYREAKDGFYFGSEANAIVAARPELRVVNPQALGEFIACSCVLENRTIFKDIDVLPAASAWTFRNAALERKTTYFDPAQWENQGTLEPEPFYQELRGVLAARIPRYVAGRQGVGIAMRGGLDTRVILALHPPAPGTLPSYTYGGPFRDSRDVLVGRKIAGICHQPHQVITVGDEFLNAFPQYAESSVRVTEGTVDVSRAPDLFLSEKARAVAPAKVVGTYGSEIVRQAVMFKPVEPLPGLFASDFLPQIRNTATTYAALRRQHPVTFAAFRQSPWYHHGILALEKSRFTVHSPFMDNEFVRTVYRAPQGSSSNGDIRLRLIRDSSPALARIPSDRGVSNDGGLLSALRRYYQEFTFKAEYAYDYGMPQAVSRIDHFFSPLHLERLFLGRHKLLHFRVWYRGQLAPYVREMLLNPRTLSRSYLVKNRVEQVVEGHLTGGLNYTTAIHKLLTLELLHRLLLDGQG